MKAIWNERIIAESDDVVNVEGYIYFPAESVNKEFLKDSDTNTVCHWKGTASYFTIDMDGNTNLDAAWYYPEPRPLADGIKGRIAFWKGVRIIKG